MLPPLWQDLEFLSPVSDARADDLAAWVAAGLVDGGTVLDVGCGWAELLLRVLEAAPRARGVGVDLDADRVAEGRSRASARGLGDRVDLVAGPGREVAPGPVEALLVLGSSQVWGPDVEEGLPLDYAAALRAMRGHVVPGARVLYAEAVWSAPPTPAAVAPLSGRDDEFLAPAALAALVADHGFSVRSVEEADLEEWDAFESGFVARQERWLAAHPADHPGAVEVAAAAHSQRTAYAEGYRGVLGFAFLRLVAV
ncbi:methyltransferase family protein [Nocardioides aurantiacus]|uniref:Methyltransferase family protein n=1 Tax=Nocardioides aurantiacus TaxID=86796 RepID=A0A3N2CTP5_9ACTN|nr:methyltransferase family protein [Nocardioides aurantiacus]